MARIKRKADTRKERSGRPIVRRHTVGRSCAGCHKRFTPEDYAGPWCAECLSKRSSEKK